MDVSLILVLLGCGVTRGKGLAEQAGPALRSQAGDPRPSPKGTGRAWRAQGAQQEGLWLLRRDWVVERQQWGGGPPEDGALSFPVVADGMWRMRRRGWFLEPGLGQAPVLLTRQWMAVPFVETGTDTLRSAPGVVCYRGGKLFCKGRMVNILSFLHQAAESRILP